MYGRTFTDAYGEHAAIKGILDIFGLLKMFGCDSYNPTWWFYNCIIVLYLLFPFLNKWLWKTPYMLISIAVSIGLFGFIPGLNVISKYLLVFVIGILISRIPVQWLKNTKWWHVLIAFILLAAWRLTKSCPKHISDSLLVVGMALFLYKVPLKTCIQNALEALGRHSMNMFLTHTFIFYFWFSKFIYITRNPFLIFLSLLISCYLLSLFIEWTKRKVKFYKLL